MVMVEVGGKSRPAIVVRRFPEEQRVVVLYGTGTKRVELAGIEVPSNSAAGKALRLTKDTFFYATSLRSVRLGHVTATAGLCPPELFLQVRYLVEGALAILSSSAQEKDLSEDARPRPVQAPE
ncbi:MULTISPECIES: hypothetical protein [unclassified Corallococcus]|uniref:hypothetical protein n=1 Tax=unclassified Corallococcus TaxID=2685029 RepID=UPI001A8C39C4|nr:MULTISPECIES: hypothetical protein [unclassified Corallococcus]MBN9680868.1 hypothetical protein [Corallococcus sp. NCSPR001]WAS87528.1 hypothetical protein O0N60_11255 [Corallococcus sp. NCRR]